VGEDVVDDIADVRRGDVTGVEHASHGSLQPTPTPEPIKASLCMLSPRIVRGGTIDTPQTAGHGLA
jgi:hypothetical protein